MSLADVKEGISRLPPKERAALACWIIDNLDTVTEDEDVVDAGGTRCFRVK